MTDLVQIILCTLAGLALGCVLLLLWLRNGGQS